MIISPCSIPVSYTHLLQLDGMPLKGVKSYSVSQKENGNRATLALVMDVRILGNQKPLTKFEVLKMITDEQKFSEMIFDMLHEYEMCIRDR